MDAIDQIFHEIKELSIKAGAKFDAGFFLSDAQRETDEIKARINALIMHDDPKVAHMGRCLREYFKELVKLEKMRESGGYTLRHVKRQFKRIDEREKVLIQAIREVDEGGV